MMDLYLDTNARLPSVTPACTTYSISLVSGHVVGLFIIFSKFKAILKILFLGTMI